MHRTFVAIVVPFILVAAVACTPQANREPQEPAAATADTPLRLSLPFDRYQWNPYEAWLLEQARYQLLKHCVQDQGLGFTMPEDDGRSDLAKYFDNSRRYGVVDEAAAARFGYHVPVSRQSEQRRVHLQNWGKMLSDEEEIAIYGAEGKPGCYQAADSVLGRSVSSADTGWLQQQSASSLGASGHGDAFERATDVWVACMFASGLPYDDPDQAIGDARWDLGSPEITELEIKTARADTGCKRSSGLWRLQHATEVAAQQRVIARHPEKFKRLEAAKDSQLRVVCRILAKYC